MSPPESGRLRWCSTLAPALYPSSVVFPKQTLITNETSEGDGGGACAVLYDLVLYCLALVMPQLNMHMRT